jgi:hypothetical protein
VEFDWARYACQAIRVRFEFAMRVQRMVMVPFDGWNPRDSGADLKVGLGG